MLPPGRWSMSQSPESRPFSQDQECMLIAMRSQSLPVNTPSFRGALKFPTLWLVGIGRLQSIPMIIPYRKKQILGRLRYSGVESQQPMRRIPPMDEIHRCRAGLSNGLASFKKTIHSYPNVNRYWLITSLLKLSLPQPSTTNSSTPLSSVRRLRYPT